MSEPFRILTVCVGNVCRSPVAERLLRLRLQGAGASYDVSSAGLHGMVGRPIHPDAAAQLRRLGGDDQEFKARRLTPDLLGSADLVLTATVDVRRMVVEETPAAMRRTFTLREFAELVRGVEADSPAELVAAAAQRRGSAGGDLDIVDPMGCTEAVHAEAARLVAEAAEVIAEALLRCRTGRGFDTLA